MRYEKPKVEVIHFSQSEFLVASWNYSFIGYDDRYGVLECGYVDNIQGYQSGKFRCENVLAVLLNDPSAKPERIPKITFECPGYFY